MKPITLEEHQVEQEYQDSRPREKCGFRVGDRVRTILMDPSRTGVVDNRMFLYPTHWDGDWISVNFDKLGYRAELACHLVKIK